MTHRPSSSRTTDWVRRLAGFCSMQSGRGDCTWTLHTAQDLHTSKCIQDDCDRTAKHVCATSLYETVPQNKPCTTKPKQKLAFSTCAAETLCHRCCSSHAHEKTSQPLVKGPFIYRRPRAALPLPPSVPSSPSSCIDRTNSTGKLLSKLPSPHAANAAMHSPPSSSSSSIPSPP